MRTVAKFGWRRTTQQCVDSMAKTRRRCSEKRDKSLIKNCSCQEVLLSIEMAWTLYGCMARREASINQPNNPPCCEGFEAHRHILSQNKRSDRKSVASCENGKRPTSTPYCRGSGRCEDFFARHDHLGPEAFGSQALSPPPLSL